MQSLSEMLDFTEEIKCSLKIKTYDFSLTF